MNDRPERVPVGVADCPAPPAGDADTAEEEELLLDELLLDELLDELLLLELLLLELLLLLLLGSKEKDEDEDGMEAVIDDETAPTPADE